MLGPASHPRAENDRVARPRVTTGSRAIFSVMNSPAPAMRVTALAKPPKKLLATEKTRWTRRRLRRRSKKVFQSRGATEASRGLGEAWSELARVNDLGRAAKDCGRAGTRDERQVTGRAAVEKEALGTQLTRPAVRPVATAAAWHG